MPKPSTGKLSIKGTRLGDTITINGDNIVTNGVPKAYDSSVLAAGVIVKGDAGNDTITGGSGPDELDGGRDNDTLIGGAGLDKLIGGDGNDTLIDLDSYVTDSDLEDGIDPNANGGATFDGGRGIDTLDFSGLTTAVGVDLDGSFLTGATHFDYGGHPVWNFDQSISRSITGIENLVGGGGDDWLWGTRFDNEIRGGGGDDYLNGKAGNDRLLGEIGNDLLLGLEGDDILDGGDGSDFFQYIGINSNGADLIYNFDLAGDGDADADTLWFSYMADGDVTWASSTVDGLASITGSFATGSVTLVGITMDQLAQVQTLYTASDF